MNRCSVRCYLARPRPSSFVLVLEFVPALKRSSTRTRDEGRGRTRLVHGTDARPMLEVEALHEPSNLPAGFGVRRQSPQSHRFGSSNAF